MISSSSHVHETLDFSFSLAHESFFFLSAPPTLWKFFEHSLFLLRKGKNRWNFFHRRRVRQWKWFFHANKSWEVLTRNSLNFSLNLTEGIEKQKRRKMPIKIISSINRDFSIKVEGKIFHCENVAWNFLDWGWVEWICKVCVLDYFKIRFRFSVSFIIIIGEWPSQENRKTFRLIMKNRGPVRESESWWTWTTSLEAIR